MKAISNRVWRGAADEDLFSVTKADLTLGAPIDREGFAEASGLGIVTADVSGTVS